jgi:Acetyltransferase (GNAT) domain
VTALVEGLSQTSAEMADRESSVRVILCADAVAAWHSAWLASFGQRFVKDENAWRALDAPHFIYLAGITLQPDAPTVSVSAAPGTVCDSWSCLDLAPSGFRLYESEAWFSREPGPLPVEEVPPELELVQVSTPEELVEFEAVSVRGFDNEEATVAPGSVHPAAIFDDPRMVMWLGRVEGRAVAAAMSYRTDSAVGVFGVTTVASARRRGYASALTRASIEADTALPSVLMPSEMAERMYERLGYRHVGELRKWVRASPDR